MDKSHVAVFSFLCSKYHKNEAIGNHRGGNEWLEAVDDEWYGKLK